jgi:hypothetical protein
VEMLSEDQRSFLYASNMEMPPKRKKRKPDFLSTTSSVKMCDVSSYIKHLPKGRHVGITSPTVYVGSEGSTFNAHREDAGWEGMNHLIVGDPKVW